MRLNARDSAEEAVGRSTDGSRTASGHEAASSSASAFKGRTKGMATRANTVAFGHYGLMGPSRGALETPSRGVPPWRSARAEGGGTVGGKVWIAVSRKPTRKKPAAAEGEGHRKSPKGGWPW